RLPPPEPPSDAVLRYRELVGTETTAGTTVEGRAPRTAAQTTLLTGGDAIHVHVKVAGPRFFFFKQKTAYEIERATELARKMVCEWGMSELGPLSFGKKEEPVFLGREGAPRRDYSEETAIRIDEQVKKFVQGAYDEAVGVIAK